MYRYEVSSLLRYAFQHWRVSTQFYLRTYKAKHNLQAKNVETKMLGQRKL